MDIFDRAVPREALEALGLSTAQLDSVRSQLVVALDEATATLAV
jgi:hypothetical protein